MEPRFGHDFSRVRVHTDATASESAHAVNALAYTAGENIAFAAGQYAPATKAGQWLLAHELAHTVQQAPTVSSHLQIGSPNDPLEHEADSAARSIMSDGPAAPALTASAGSLQRKCPPTPTGIGNTPSPEACARAGPDRVDGKDLQFCQDSTELEAGQAAWLAGIIADAKRATAIELHGNASTEGPSAEYNFTLACKRAAAVASQLRAAGVTTPMKLVSHGPTTAYGDTEINRNVMVRLTLPPPPPTKTTPTPTPQKPSGTPSGGIDDCTPTHEAEVKIAYAAARNGTADVASAIMQSPRSSTVDAALKKFFGPTPNATRIAIRLRTINRELRAATIECENPGSWAYGFFCKPGTQGYTRGIPAFFGLGSIHLCQPEFHNSTENQRTGTIVHEASHRFLGTSDNAYYTLNCDETTETQNMTDSDRDDNADCYGCLVQTLI